MTVEEIEIVVTAKVEEAIKDFKKIVPAVKGSMKQVQATFNKLDTKTMQNKFNQTVQVMKKKMQDLKKSSENNEIAIKVNNADAKKQITQIEKEVDSLQKKVSEKTLELKVVTTQVDADENQPTQQFDIEEQLDSEQSKDINLEQGTNEGTNSQGKLSSFFSNFKEKIEQIKGSLGSVFSQIPKMTQKVGGFIKTIGSGLKNGIGNIVKYIRKPVFHKTSIFITK